MQSGVLSLLESTHPTTAQLRHDALTRDGLIPIISAQERKGTGFPASLLSPRTSSCRGKAPTPTSPAPSQG
jgi:hypothetical protein